MSDTPDASSTPPEEIFEPHVAGEGMDAVEEFEQAEEAAESAVAVEAPSPALEEASEPYIGEWNQLVSTTNWEKGRIICAWRAALIDSGAPVSEYADETWARLVGGVTGQHVGRLRRVYQRFGQTRQQYRRLYWSHFQAAIDWDDAEMWLEGAVQSGWSVAQMRKQRWETLGAVAADAPQDEDIVAGELDEDFEPAQKSEPIPDAIAAEMGEVSSGPTYEGPDFGDEDEASVSSEGSSTSYDDEAVETQAPKERIRPFESLGDLPDDVADAVDKFKLVILKHRREGWQALSCDDMVAALESLKQLALAPADEEPAPF